MKYLTLTQPQKTREGYECKLIDNEGLTLYKLTTTNYETAKEYYYQNRSKQDWSQEIAEYAKANNPETSIEGA